MTSKGPEELTIGVDVSKRHVEAACYASGRQEHFTNDAAGFRAFRRWIGPVRRSASPSAGSGQGCDPHGPAYSFPPVEATDAE
jgi:hypothetical protein